MIKQRHFKIFTILNKYLLTNICFKHLKDKKVKLFIFSMKTNNIKAKNDTIRKIIDNSTQNNQINNIDYKIKTSNINNSKNNYLKSQILFLLTFIISSINLDNPCFPRNEA